MAVPRAPSQGLYGSGTYPNFTHPIDIGGAIQAAAGAASTTIHNAFLRKIATQNANLAAVREAREGRIAQENADTNKAYRDAFAAQRQSQANLAAQEAQMRTPEFQAAYADAMQNGTPSSIAHVASVVAGHPNAGAILAPLVRPDPKMNHIVLPDGRVMMPDPDHPNQIMPVIDSSTGKPTVGAKPTPSPIQSLIDREAITRSTTADRNMSALMIKRPQQVAPVKGPFGMVDQNATNANRAAFTADSTTAAGEQTAAHQGLTDLGLRPAPSAVPAVPAGGPVNPVDALRSGLRSGAITMDHVKASTTIPQPVKDQLSTEFPAPSQAARTRLKVPAAPPVVNSPAQTPPAQPITPIPMQSTSMGGVVAPPPAPPAPDDED